MNFHKILLLSLCGVALAGCASNSDTPVRTGDRSEINGIEAWRDGVPDRPYQVIASVSRRGANPGATYDDEEALVAADARRRGADAIIIQNDIMIQDRMDPITGRPVMAPQVNAELIKYK